MIINKKEEFFTNKYTLVNFSNDALSPIREIYYNLRERAYQPTDDLGIKLHENENGEFNGTRMLWAFAKSNEAITFFRKVLDGCELAIVRDLVGNNRDNMRVIQANIIEIKGSYPVGKWHSDLTDVDLGPNQCATLLTPLFTLADHIGGLEITLSSRESLLYDNLSSVYKYKDGQAILFDGSSMIHRTQSYQAGSDEVRVIISWQLAYVDDKMAKVLNRIGRKNGDPMFLDAH